METHGLDRKKVAAVARQKRKQLLKERRSKRNRVDENGLNYNVGFNMYNPPSRVHVRKPLSNITYAMLNERNQNSNAQTFGSIISTAQRLNVGVNEIVSFNLYKHFGLDNQHYASPSISKFTTPTSTSGSSKSTITPEDLSTKQVAVSARQRRKTIIQKKMSQEGRHGQNIVNNNGCHMLFNSPVSFNRNTPQSGITSSWSNQRYNSFNAHPSGFVFSSKKQLNVGVIRSMTANLFNTFANIDNGCASSSTSNLPINTNASIESDQSFEDDSTDESVSDSSCEFINENAEYDTSSSVDEEEEYDPNPTPTNCRIAGM